MSFKLKSMVKIPNISTYHKSFKNPYMYILKTMYDSIFAFFSFLQNITAKQKHYFSMCIRHKEDFLVTP